MNRRRFVQAAGAAVAVMPFGPAWSASDAEIHFMTWPTSDGTAMISTAAPPFEKATGVKVVPDQPPSSTGLVPKLKAAGAHQWADVATLLASQVLELSREGLLQKPDISRLKNIGQIPEKYRLMYRDSAVGFASAVYGLSYSKQVYPQGPKSLTALWDPKNAGKLLLPPANIIHAMQLVIIAGKLAGVDSFKEPDSAFKKLAELKGRVLTMSTQPQQVGELFRNGSLAVGYTSFAALSSVIKNPDYGIGVSVRELEEGWVAEILGLSIPNGHPGPDEAIYAFIDQILTPEVATAVQEAAWFVPLISSATTPQHLLDQGFPGSQDLAHAITYDLEQLAVVRGDWTKRYSDIFSNI
jgi:putative spermidine/putrescine transport system substrate-binding protein